MINCLINLRGPRVEIIGVFSAAHYNPNIVDIVNL